MKSLISAFLFTIALFDMEKRGSNYEHYFGQNKEAQVINVLGGQTKEIKGILENADVILNIGLRRDPEQVLAYFKSVRGC